MNMIRVMNDHPQAIRGRYDGKDYVFAPGKGEDIPFDAAAHIFGFGSDDKAGALNRLGQLPPNGDVSQAMTFFDKIRFLEGKMVFEDDQEERARLQSSPGPMSQESGDDRSHVRSSGDAGAGQPAPAASKTLSLKK
jgi:hypothetical protein